CRQNPEPQLPDGDYGHLNPFWWGASELAALLGSYEQRCVRETDVRTRAAAHQKRMSSVVSGRSSCSSTFSPGSACQSSRSRTNSSQVSVSGRRGSGMSSATGRPLTVTP